MPDTVLRAVDTGRVNQKKKKKKETRFFLLKACVTMAPIYECTSINSAYTNLSKYLMGDIIMSHISIQNYYSFHIKYYNGLRYNNVSINLFFECLTMHKAFG